MSKITSPEMVNFYNKIPMKERSLYEFELRYLSDEIDQFTMIELIRSILKTSNIEVQEFIDTVDYLNNTKIGTRSYIKNSKVVDTISYKKERIKVENYKNMVGKYSINISKEIVLTDDADMSIHSSVVLLKRRYRYVLPKYPMWRCDLSIIRKTEPSTECVKSAFEEFFMEINDFEELVHAINTRLHIYQFQIEIEFIGKKDIAVEDIDKILIAPYLCINKDIEILIKYQQDLLFLSEIINNGIKMLPPRKVSSNIYLKYIIPQVRTLTKQQYFNIYPPTKFLLKEKIDGNRVIIIARNNTLSLLLNPNNSFFQPMPKYKNTIVADGELLENEKIISIFDIMIFDNEDVQTLGIEYRISYITVCCHLLNKHSSYKFVPANYTSLANVSKYKTIMEEKISKSEFPTDGLIFVQTKLSYKDGVTYKWKSLDKQTIDFLCKKCPVHLLKRGNYPTKDKHTLYLLYTTASRSLIQNLNLTNNYGFNELFVIEPDYKNLPIPFATPFVPLAYIYYHSDSSDLEIDNEIIELGVSTECINYIKSNNAYFINWQLHRVRKDKTVIPGLSYGNNYATALYSLLNCINVFNVEYLWMGIPPDSYYQNRGGEVNTYSGIRSLGNYIKTQLISEYARKANGVIDIGSGRGGDLYKYVQQNLVKNLLILDKDKNSICELFSRWLEMAKISPVPLHTSLRAAIIDINNPYQSNISAIKGITQTTFYDTIFVHSSLHYFTMSVDSIRNFILFCKGMTTSKGHIIITCPYGEKIYDHIKDNVQWNIIENDTIKYSIHKKFTDDTMTEAGQKISILLPFSKGKMYDEYLVNTEAITTMFKEYGFSRIFKKSYVDYFESFNIYTKRKYDMLTKNDKEMCKLYVAMGFRHN